LFVNVYFHQMKSLADSLTSIGQPLWDEEFLSYLLAGLDKDYDALYQVVNSRTTCIPIRDLFSQLLATEIYPNMCPLYIYDMERPADWAVQSTQINLP
jgi:hypothetical protein